jgi:ribonuclease J
MLTLTLYGGVGVIGGTKALLEDGDSRLFFDFGTDYAARGDYFEEFLAPRSGQGLLDLLEMGLLPPLEGLYRPDLAPPGDVWARYRDQPHYRELSPVDAVLVSHDHLDHTGYISFLRPEIPIFATSMTAFIAKAVQDSSGSDFEREVVYLSQRAAGGEGVLGVLRGGGYQGRPFALVDAGGLAEEALDFRNWSPAKTKKLVAAVLLDAPGKVGRLAVRHFPVDHSVYGACAWGVETSAGWVIYTGDIRFGTGSRSAESEAFIEAAQALRPRALLCEGTRAPPPGEPAETPVSEDQVRENALREVRAAGAGLVIADFGPRNVDRLRSFLTICQEVGRQLVVLAKDAYLLDAMRLVDPDLPDLSSDPCLRLYSDPKAQPALWEQRMRDRYAGRFVTPAEVGRAPGDFVLCFSFWDIKNLIDIRPSGGRYIYSASEAFSEEQMIDVDRLANWLKHFDMEGVGLPRRDLGGKPLPEEAGLHASGHAGPDDLLRLVRQVAPKTLIPVHTESPGYFREALAGSDIEVVEPEYGRPIHLG